ncbi:coiled-coil domain containing 157 [Turdus rufiventris]|nr:coiled-coil domain containing 157 [Turdus rufiventris]
MAHLLGHRGCMESLRADLRDLQAAIADVCSRAGAVRFPSWKFPDKVSCDLDISVLLQRYRHSDSDPEFSQHAHVVLLELLIDRVHELGSSGSSQPRAGSGRAQSTRSVPTQTPGSPLGSCDTCSSAQASLHEVGRAITSICQSQNIPSALSKFQEALEDSAGRRKLSAADMSYWATEQSKDLSRINKHLQGLLQQVNPVKAELEKMGKQKEKLQKQVEDFSRKLQAEKDTQAEQQRKAEQSLKAKEKEHSEAVARLERDKDDLRRGTALLEERLSALKEELAAKQVAVQELELSKTTLLEEMRTTMVARSQVLELEEKVQVLTGQRDSLEQKLSATSLQLEKEKVRVESMFRHEESLQAKQRALLQQLDSLDQEREELEASLGEAEEDKAQLAEQLEQSQQQSGKQLQAQQELLDTLQQEKLALEQSILELQANTSRLEEQAQELRERERLLVFFPDLHVPAEMQFESSGNLTEDMESQLQANNIRIQVLEQENAQLKALLAKVKAAAEQGVLKLVPQAQLGSQLHREASRQGTPRSVTHLPEGLALQSGSAYSAMATSK